MEQFLRSSHFSGGNAAYIEDLYDNYLHERDAVPAEWRGFFDELPKLNGGVQPDVSHATIVQHFELLGRRKARPTPAPGSGGIYLQHERKQVRVVQLISAYRFRGHQKASLDPLALMERQHVQDLELHFHGLTPADLDTTFQTSPMHIGKDEATLREIIETLEETYCGNLGPEFMHITSFAEKQWLAQRFESVRSKPTYDDAARIDVLNRLTAAEGLEKHLDSRYPGTKRFGLEGGESLIPMLDCLIRRSGEYGCKEIVMAMAHRGRLNVLVNILGKNPAEMFEEFEGKRLVNTSGDVKYHQGFSSNVMTPGGELHLALGFNPSHLEISCPVVIGSARARQDRRNDESGEKVVPILLHGDAAFAGQGVVMETFQLSQTRAYKTGGTIHVVINNQVGFTTSRQDDARSTEYCTDVAKMVQAPILHVNGDNPDSVMFAAMLAMDYRYEFGKDIVIDLVCYRRRGHNETDEPSSTQPLMYKAIRNHPTTRSFYAQKLIQEGVLSLEQAEEMTNRYRSSLDRGEFVVHNLVSEPDHGLFVDWAPYLGHQWRAPGDTRAPLSLIRKVADVITQIPENVQVQRQVAKLYDDRRKMAAGELPLNWGMAELLSYGSLIEQGYPIRFTGQDVRRGTFSHRHAVVVGQNDNKDYVPLQQLASKDVRFELYDSLLSEEAVLAFEYGYSTTMPTGLVVWEAQFGDFANGAQVVIDQFIASGEHKWGRLSGLTMLLPHGFEGQGPEHSSARLERFLQLCAEHNMQICIPTTPAQIFHLLRRQAIRPMRRPLIIMSPKWILRHKQAVSSLEDLVSGSFKTVMPDSAVDAAQVQRLVLCSGKVYYHLNEERQARGISNISLVRLEQLYPFPDTELDDVLKGMVNLREALWCQEEPMNQGAWYSSQHHMRNALSRHKPDIELTYVGRKGSAAPASGYMSVHVEEQAAFIDKALTINETT